MHFKYFIKRTELFLSDICHFGYSTLNKPIGMSAEKSKNVYGKQHCDIKT
jgi:hypothetical protein